MKIKTFDVSGFGGDYEATCQKMIWNGVRFGAELKEQPVYKEYKNIFGICFPENKAAEDLDKAILAGISDATGAMHQCATGHIRYILKHGYAEWFRTLGEARLPEEQPYEFDYEPEFVLS